MRKAARLRHVRETRLWASITSLRDGRQVSSNLIFHFYDCRRHDEDLIEIISLAL